MRFSPLVTLAFQLAALTLLVAQSVGSSPLLFTLTGTYDSPDSVYPLTSPRFEVSFQLSSDPGNTVSGFDLVELFAPAAYLNDHLSTGPLARTFLLFDSASNGGGIYMYLPVSALLPFGLSINFAYGGIPQLYSNTAANPHFSSEVISFASARDRYADQGVNEPMSNISNGLLTVTAIPEPSSSFLLTISAALLAGACAMSRRKDSRVSRTKAALDAESAPPDPLF